MFDLIFNNNQIIQLILNNFLKYHNNINQIVLSHRIEYNTGWDKWCVMFNKKDIREFCQFLKDNKYSYEIKNIRNQTYITQTDKVITFYKDQ